MVTSVSVVGFGPVPEVTLPGGDEDHDDDGTRPRARRRSCGPTLHMDAPGSARRPVLRPRQLREGDVVEGPAVIDDHLGTIVVNPGAVARVGEPRHAHDRGLSMTH